MIKNPYSFTDSDASFAENGGFNETRELFDTPFGDGPGHLPAEAGRYRVYWAKVCPWATRTVLTLKLLGLEDIISVGLADSQLTETEDWPFKSQPDGRDPVTGHKTVTDAYTAVGSQYSEYAVVPTVVDLETNKIVSNDFINLPYHLEEAFKPFHKEGAPDLLPAALKDEMLAFNGWMHTNINNAVYDAGFAESQEEYEEAFDRLFGALDEVEERLADRRYLFGSEITDADVRLFVTLARFDVAYYTALLVNKKQIKDYPNLWGYARDLYTIPEFKEVTDFDAIKLGFFSENDGSDEVSIIPRGPDLSGWDEPHGREGL